MSEGSPLRSRIRARLLAGVALCLTIYVVFDWAPWESRLQGRRLGQWLESLKSGDDRERAEAEGVLIYFGPQAAEGLARILVYEESAMDRKYAAFYRGAPGPLANLLPEPSNHILAQQAAGRLLESLGSAAEVAWPILRNSLSSTNNVVRQHTAAVYTSVLPHDPETIEAILRAYLDDPKGFRGWGWWNWLTKRHPEIMDGPASELLNALEAELQQPNPNAELVAYYCADLNFLAADSGTARAAIPIMEKVRGDPSLHIASYAHFNLWKWAPDRSEQEQRTKVLSERIQSSESWHWSDALFYVAQRFTKDDMLDAETIARSILKKIKAEPRTTSLGLMALDRLGASAAGAGEEIWNQIEPGFYDSDGSLDHGRINAAVAITGRIEDAIPTLIESLASPQGKYPSSSSLLAMVSLARIGPPAKEAIPLLRSKLETDDHSLRYEAAKALWKIAGDPDALLPLLEDALERTMPPSRFQPPAETFLLACELGEKATSLLPRLMELANHPRTWTQTREWAIEAIMQIDCEALNRVDQQRVTEALPQIKRNPLKALP
jgi:HEAT repeat protein